MLEGNYLIVEAGPMRHVYHLRYLLSTKKLKLLSLKDQVGHMRIALSHVIRFTGRGRGDKVQRGKSLWLLHSNKLILFIG